jgi:hypothetical protein
MASTELKPQPKVQPSNNPSSHPQETINDWFGTSNESATQPRPPPAPNYNHLAKAWPLAQRPTLQSSSPLHSLSTSTTQNWYKPPPQLALNSLQVKMMVTRTERECQMREKQEAQMGGIQKMEEQRLQRIDKKKERDRLRKEEEEARKQEEDKNKQIEQEGQSNSENLAAAVSPNPTIVILWKMRCLTQPSTRTSQR